MSSLCANNVLNAVNLFENNEFECIVLDINLGKESGFNLCSIIRQTSSIPIIFCSCRRQDEDILRAFCLGGDDYITKPFSLEIMVAKIKVILRRYSTEVAEKVRWKCFEINNDTMTVSKDGKPISLSTTEFKLFSFLIANSNKVIDKFDLISAVCGNGYCTTDTLNVHIRKLREKTESFSNSPQFIKTVWGIGYRLDE